MLPDVFTSTRVHPPLPGKDYTCALSHLKGDRFSRQEEVPARMAGPIMAGVSDVPARGARLVIRQLQALLTLATSLEHPPKNVGRGVGLRFMVVYPVQNECIDDEYRGSKRLRRQLS